MKFLFSASICLIAWASATTRAPTASGGACTSGSDYDMWIQEVDGMDGLERFALDLKTCSAYCLSASLIYNCGGFGDSSCPDTLRATCIGDCINQQPPVSTQSNAPEILQIGVYSEPCTDCIAGIAECGIDECALQCASGNGVESEACRKCNEEKCNPTFLNCSGLNPEVHHAELDLIPVIAGAVGGFGALVIFAVACAIWDRQRSRKNKNMTHADLQRLAAAQSMQSMTSMVKNDGSVTPNSPETKNPKYTSGHTSYSSAQPLTPYQQQYQAQQEALARGQVENAGRMAPSVRVSEMAAQAVLAPPELGASATRLLAIYDFVGERPDELTVTMGARLFGIESQDGWWLAKTEKGNVGLIPVNYCEEDNGANPLDAANDPDF